MPENTSELLTDTNSSLMKLLAETEEKSRLEMERITLERERAKKQEEILESENKRNKLLEEVTNVVKRTNIMLNELIVPTINNLNVKTSDIWKTQETLIHFLITEYGKLNDVANKEIIDMLKETLVHMTNAKNEVHVVGSMHAEQDVNLTSNNSGNIIKRKN